MSEDNKKIRIVLLTDCLADLAGGAEKQIYELAKGLDKNRYDVFVVSLDTWGEAPREVIEATGSRLHIFKVVRVYGLSGFREGVRFKKFLKDEKIDVILTYHFSSDMWGTFWGHKAGVKTIISNRRDMGFWRNELHVLAYRFINKWVSKVVVVSESIKDMVVQTEGLKPSIIDVIYNGVDLPDTTTIRPSEVRARHGLDEGDLVIMHVANLKPVKGHQYLLDAFAGIVQQFPRARLVLIGKDELGGKLQQQAESLKIQDKVLFLGKQDNVPELLSAADVCVLPSLSEGMSNSILEYMAAGKPVVATNVGGNPELINDAYNGRLVKPADAISLREGIALLLKSREMRQRLGNNGLNLVKSQFAMGAMVSRYERLFSGLRVLHLISSGGLFGAERVILNLASRSTGITSYVGALNNKHNPHLEIIGECKRLGLNYVVFDSGGQIDLRTVGKVKDFLIDNRIDILHTHNYKSDMVGFAATRLAGKKWVATNHVWHSTDNKLRMYERMDAMVLKHASKVIGVSQEIVDDLVRKKFNKDRLEVVDNGITIEQFGHNLSIERWRSWLGVGPEEHIIVIVGRLAKEKGHEVFFQAASLVLEKRKDVRFVVVGDGPLRDALKKKVKVLDIARHVVFTGLQGDMPTVYAASDIMVNASFIEGLPMTILEAMAAKLPVIATNVGAVGKVIENGVNGILLEAGDPEAIAKAVLDLVAHKAKAKRFAEKAFADVNARFSDTRMAQRYLEIYNGVIGR